MKEKNNKLTLVMDQIGSLDQAVQTLEICWNRRGQERE